MKLRKTVVEIPKEPYYLNGFWYLDVKYKFLGAIKSAEFFAKNKEDLSTITIGFKFY